jgi:2-methylisocitrate lyase-like PEP mutase family enzyme
MSNSKIPQSLSHVAKCKQFARLHNEAAFLIPNPGDAESARMLQGPGFKALATTSSGLAYTLGRNDGEVTLDEKLDHCTALAAITDIPINADLEDGFSKKTSEVAINLNKLIKTGMAGCSIEDYNREKKELYSFETAASRIEAAAEVVAAANMPFQLTARAENLLRGVNDIDDTIKRLQAYSAAGANVLYAPGINSLEKLKLVTDAIDKPFNVLAPFLGSASVAEMAEAGAQRTSVGDALNWISVSPLIRAGKEMLEKGTFNWLGEMAPGAEVKRLLSRV